MAPGPSPMASMPSISSPRRTTRSSSWSSPIPCGCCAYGIHRDSGGAGRYRGGCGVVREYEVLADTAQVAIRIDSVVNPPWGVAGGLQRRQRPRRGQPRPRRRTGAAPALRRHRAEARRRAAAGDRRRRRLGPSLRPAGRGWSAPMSSAASSPRRPPPATTAWHRWRRPRRHRRAAARRPRPHRSSSTAGAMSMPSPDLPASPSTSAAPSPTSPCRMPRPARPGPPRPPPPRATPRRPSSPASAWRWPRPAARPAEIGRVLHGTTVATNLILEGKTAPTALLTTQGFRHVLEIGRADLPRRDNLWSWQKPRRPVPPAQVYEVAGRIAADGSELTPLDEAAVARRRPGRRRRRGRAPSPSASCTASPTRRTNAAPLALVQRRRRPASPSPPRPTCCPWSANTNAAWRRC